MPDGGWRFILADRVTPHAVHVVGPQHADHRGHDRLLGTAGRAQQAAARRA
ncbi:hypothetical protein [Amycolatopsis aidingensis]|uniref:hypothetical protein n=1 Tax=Amycolatopsis aidingensis TaxID=2842453 RepID=UPI001C0E63E6|nr:hypothetical protein [Amycolatopsis aidingensis]